MKINAIITPSILFMFLFPSCEKKSELPGFIIEFSKDDTLIWSTWFGAREEKKSEPLGFIIEFSKSDTLIWSTWFGERE